MSSYTHEGTKKRWDKYQLPASMGSLSYMDVGTWDGKFVRHAIELGARRALGVDYVTGRDMLDIPFVQCDVLSDKFLALPRYDIVTCIGVIYHLSNPVGLVQRLKLKARRLLLLESEYVELDSEEPLWKLLPANEGRENYSNWWFPNVQGLESLLVACGFDTEMVFKNDHRVAFLARPRNEMSKKIQPREMKCMP